MFIRLIRGSVCAVPVWFFLSSGVHAASIGEQAPVFSLPSVPGQEMSLDEYKGKVILLNFWASWCPPCKEELPELEKLHQKYQEENFEVVGINVDKKKENAVKYIERFELTFTVLLDPESEVVRSYQGRSMPISYLIDQDGVIREIFFGFNRKKLPHMEASIKEMIDGNGQ